MGRFELLDRIAVGGMAEVFVACERGALDLNRLVVIKRILPHLAQDTAFVDMFLQEARIAARIHHPNVVQIYELGEDGGFPFIAMEYVPGSTLRQLQLAAQEMGLQMPVGVALALGMQACAGAHAAHEMSDGGRPMQIVHRDLSPHNLMVSDDGHLKVVDFGIAKATEGMDKTRTGVLKGKISYLSPEQCRQQAIDRRSDLFTLSIVLWELLAGEKLFEGGGELGTMQAIVGGSRRDLRPIRPDVPELVVRTLERGLLVDPDDRYADAEEMRHALKEAASRSGLSATQEDVASFVAGLLGPEHRARQTAVDTALERTLSQHDTSEAPLELDAPTSVSIVTVGGWVAGAAGVGVAVLAVAALVLVVVVAVLVADGGSQTSHPELPPVPVFPGAPVEVRLAPTIDPDILLADLEPLRGYLARSLERNVTFAVGTSYQETADALVSGEVPFASLPPYTYVLAHARDPRVRVVAIKVYDDSTGSDSVLLVPEDSDVDAVTDLIGRRICYSDPYSTTGYVLPRGFLRSKGIDPDRDFSEVRISGNHLQVLRDLTNGLCDVGGTYTGAYLSAREAGVDVAKTRVIGIAGRSPHDALCVGPAAAADLAARLQDALVAFDPREHAGVDRMGRVEKITGFTLADDSAYDKLREAVRLEKSGEEP